MTFRGGGSLVSFAKPVQIIKISICFCKSVSLNGVLQKAQPLPRADWRAGVGNTVGVANWLADQLREASVAVA